MAADNMNLPYPVRHADADIVPNHVELEMPWSRPRFQNFTILGGQGVLGKGSVLGMVTASRKLKLSAAAAGDGSEAMKFVLNVDLDTTGGDVTFDVMVGEATLNPAALVLGAGQTANGAIDALTARGFSFRTPGFSG